MNITPKDTFGRSPNDALSHPALKGEVSRVKSMSNKVAVLFSKEGCGFCIKAKHVLLSQGYTIKEKKLGVNTTRDEMLAILGREVRTVPQVMINDRYVGGYTDVCKFLDV